MKNVMLLTGAGQLCRRRCRHFRQRTLYPLHPQAAGQTLHGDHAYVFYQKPVNARKYPLGVLHGAGQSARTWESPSRWAGGFSESLFASGLQCISG